MDVLRIHTEDDQPVGRKAQRNMLKVTQGANQQPSTDKQHHAQRHLQRDDDLACAGLACVRIRCCRRCLQYQSWPGRERNPQRRQSKQAAQPAPECSV